MAKKGDPNIEFFQQFSDDLRLILCTNLQLKLKINKKFHLSRNYSLAQRFP